MSGWGTCGTCGQPGQWQCLSCPMRGPGHIGIASESGRGEWVTRALAAISEGFCPQHREPLTAQRHCASCGGSWSVADDGVTLLRPGTMATWRP